MRFEFLTPGKRVRKLRKELRMTQAEISKGFSRNLISLIENEKMELTPSITRKIVNNINNKIKANNINKELLTSEDLIKSKIGQVIVFVNEVTVNIKNDKIGSIKKTDKTIEYTIKLIQDYKIENKYMLNLLKSATDYYYKNKEYSKCKMYCVKCIHLSGIMGEKIYTLEGILTIAAIYYIDKDYKQALQYNNYATYIMDTDHIYNQTYRKKILYNSAICYINIDETDTALELLNELKQYNLAENQLVDIESMEASCYLKNNMIETAKQIYNKLKVKTSSNETLGTIHYNLAEIYIEEENLEQASKEFKTCIKHREIAKSRQLAKTLYESALVERKKENIKGAKELLIKSIKNKHAENEYYLELLNIYIEENNDKEIEGLIKLIEDNNLKEVNSVWIETIDYYLEKDINKCKYLLKKIKSNRI